jgi:5-methylcytosine-specific restriction protein A
MVRTHAERIRRAGVVREHRAHHGDWCPGYGVPPHQAADLTADDLVPVAASGRPSAVLVVLCRSCNSRKGTAENHAE